MMPQTVPNRPMKGATEPTVARKPRLPLDAVGLAQDGDVHRLVDAFLDAGNLAFARARRLRRRGAIRAAPRRTSPPGDDRCGRRIADRARPATGPTRTSSRTSSALRLSAASAEPFVEDDGPATTARPAAAAPSPPSPRCRRAGTSRRWRSRRRRHRRRWRRPPISTPAGGGGRRHAAGVGRRAGGGGGGACCAIGRPCRERSAATSMTNRSRGEQALQCHGENLVARRARGATNMRIRIWPKWGATEVITFKYLFQ